MMLFFSSNRAKAKQIDDRLLFFKKGDANITRLWIIMVLVFIIMAVADPSLFLTVDNFSSMLFQIPEFGLLSIAMMIVLITAGLDLSIVGIANVSSVMCALVLIGIPEDASSGQALPTTILAIAVAICVGLGCGLTNGLLITKVGITPILATLGTMQLFTGIALVVTKGSPFYGFPDGFIQIGNGAVGFIPHSFIIFACVVVAFFILLNKTPFGLKIYMLGANPLASKYSGVKNDKILVQTYVLSGLLSALAGLIMIARTNSANADYGNSYTLQTLLVSVLGGVSPSGGYGKITGVLLSIFTLQFLSSGFNILQVNNLFKNFIWGGVLILVVIINYYSEKRRDRIGA
jgi:simple sugar transport system permease protein